MADEKMFDMSRSNGCNENDKLNKIENNTSAPKCKVIASHCFALVIVIMFKFTYGFNTGFTSIIIPELYKKETEIKMTLNELTWFSSYCFTPPIGAIFGGFLAQSIGCRKLLAIGGIFYITSALIFYFSTNAAMFLSAQVIVGFIDGMQKGPCFTFLAEISLPQFRSIIMTCIGLGMMLGIFTATMLGNYLYWRTLALINVINPTIGLILIYFVPETPYWLASKNRYEDAKRSLAWYRGWSSPDSLEIELEMSSAILGHCEKFGSSKGTNINGNYFNSISRLTKAYINRSFYIPLLTMIFVFIVNNFCGIWTLNVFSVLVFEEINSPVDAHVAAVIFTVIRVIGSIGCLLLINLVGKRKLLFITLPMSAISLVVAAVFGYLMASNRLTSPIYHWIPTISIFLAVLFTTVGIDKISILLNSEIFPLNLRHVGVGAGHFVNTMSLSLMNKIYLYLVAAITMSGSFLFFALVNAIGLVVMYFIVPETEGKTLQEIEEHYAGRENLIKRKKSAQ